MISISRTVFHHYYKPRLAILHLNMASWACRIPGVPPIRWKTYRGVHKHYTGLWVGKVLIGISRIPSYVPGCTVNHSASFPV